MQLAIKLPLMLPRLSKNARSELSAPLLPLMKRESRNSVSSRCGNLQTEPLETSLMVQSSESQSLSPTFPDLFQDGLSPSLLVDTPTVINIDAKIMLSLLQVNVSSCSPQITEMHQLCKISIISQARVLILVCSILKLPLSLLLDPACNTLSAEDTHLNSHQRTPFWRSTMDYLKISSKEFTKMNTSKNSRLLELITNTGLLTIWSHKLSKEKVVLFGLAKTMTVMFSPILSPKVLDPSVSWLPFLLTRMALSNLRQPTELLLDITDNGRREKTPQLTQSLPFLPGAEVSPTEPKLITFQNWPCSLNSSRRQLLKLLRVVLWLKISPSWPPEVGMWKREEITSSPRHSWTKSMPSSRRNGRHTTDEQMGL